MSLQSLVFLLSALALLPWTGAIVPYSEYILAPSSRTVLPTAVYSTYGTVSGAVNLLSSGAATLTGVNSSITLDFGKETGGPIGFSVDALSGITHLLDFTFTESALYISSEASDAITSVNSPPTSLTISSLGDHITPGFRGGFRYITVVSNTAESITISNLTVTFNAVPTMSNPAAYTGYFHSDNEKLNRVWYAGAYTNQMCIIDPTTGDAFEGNAYTIANGTAVLIDGAKRSRLVWPGDIVIAGPSTYVSTNNANAIRNALDSLFILQKANGQMPYAGTPWEQEKSSTSYLYSFTYHLHTLIVTYDYYIFTGDQAYLESTWAQFKLALDYTVSLIDASGLAEVDSANDWGRRGMGGHNIQANSILYYTLGIGLQLSTEVGDTSVTANWTAARIGIRDGVIPLLWNSDLGLFSDKEGSARVPQDGNAWAIISGVVNSTIAATISTSLAARWVRPYGAPAPECGSISPFASGFELQAHYIAGRADRAVDLMSFMWADFMLDDPRTTNSTFLEGYAIDGTIQYAPYLQANSKISHAHGWSTAPTSVLTNLGAGIQLTGPAGKTWVMQPQLGGLQTLNAGFTTSLGTFSATYTSAGQFGSFVTPSGTTGSFIFSFNGIYKRIELKGPSGKLVSYNGSDRAVISGIAGGKYSVCFTLL